MSGRPAASGSSGIVLRDDAPDTGAFRADVLRGLSAPAKTLPCKYFYDERGAELFERICELDAYYPTLVELGILERHVADISAQLGPRCLIVEFGSGSGVKTQLLLDSLVDPVGYVPVDISCEQLMATAETLSAEFPRLQVLPVCADYTRPLRLPETGRPPRRTVVFFPGSTIGNFEPADAVTFLHRVARLVGTGGAALVGVDRRKDRGRLEAAYNDPEGITAAFNLNLLERINRELGADFDVTQFSHRAVYNEQAGRIEMHLVSAKPQVVHLSDGAGAETAIHFRAGEVIVTEHSYKYDIPGFSTLAERAGLTVSDVWSDPGQLFSIVLARHAGGAA